MALLQTLQTDLLALGLRPSGVLMVHASLRALGQVPGGAETVIQGLLSALGADGTLLMPALSYEHVTRENPLFDVRNTPSNVGIVPEAFRQRAGTKRSIHPTHSVCAVGPLSAALLDPHIEDTTPCGPRSPFHALPHHNGQILMLGCGLEPNTSMHAIEELAEPRYLYSQPIEYTLIQEDGASIAKSYTPHGFDGWVQRYERVQDILPPSALKRGPVLEAEAWLIESAALWEIALAALQKDPLHFVSEQMFTEDV
jgi:aminoglycoside 3-N-acetyltransferase